MLLKYFRWVFNAETIEDLVKKRIDERLMIVKTSVVGRNFYR